jgi:hypothetical protein
MATQEIRPKLGNSYRQLSRPLSGNVHNAAWVRSECLQLMLWTAPPPARECRWIWALQYDLEFIAVHESDFGP